MEEIIQLRSFSYTYPKRKAPALTSVDLSVKKGEFLLVSGPSGSGKSTLLRVMNGLVPHFSGGSIRGESYVLGMNTIEAGPQLLSNHVGFVSQNPEAQTILDRVEPEIAFALENAAVPRIEMHRRVNEVLDHLNLSSLRSRHIATLSGGERQRVAIACALALMPEILVLDEPISQLDPQSAAGVIEILHDINRSLGLTIILVEHRIDRVMPYADRLAYMENGFLVTVDKVCRAVKYISEPPPLVDLSRRLNWDPLPMTITEAEHFANSFPVGNHSENAANGSDGRIKESNTILEARDLRFTYRRGTMALDGIDLELQRGEILAIMGANGSGKSTLLKCLVGLLNPQQGDVLLYGRSTKGLETADIARQIAYLPQYPDDLLFAEKVREELEITLRNHAIPEEDRVDQTLADLELSDQAELYPRDLSTGQRQRVALGSITVTRPHILLLDEPTRGQDSSIKKQLVRIWRGYKESGMCIVIVTHDSDLVAQTADRVIILDGGKIEASGETAAVLSEASPFAPLVARLWPGRGWLTVEEIASGLDVPVIQDNLPPMDPNSG